MHVAASSNDVEFAPPSEGGWWKNMGAVMSARGVSAVRDC